jgi:oxalate decarboxylase
MGSNENPAPHHETPAFGNPDLPQEGMVNITGDPASATMTGPRNPVLESQFPNVITAPGTDISTQPFFWSSFNISPRRQQRGGWAREVTQADFAISNEIAGVNMYLEPGGIRELHWHQTAEWALMTEGKCRVTTLSREGMPSVEDVFAGDLWFFPTGLPHSLQGLGPDGAEFVLAFDDGAQSESNTLLLTDWFAHTPARRAGNRAAAIAVCAKCFSTCPLTGGAPGGHNPPVPLSAGCRASSVSASGSTKRSRWLTGSPTCLRSSFRRT